MLALKVEILIGETAIAAGIGVGAIFAGPLGGIGLGMVAAAYYC